MSNGVKTLEESEVQGENTQKVTSKYKRDSMKKQREMSMAPLYMFIGFVALICILLICCVLIDTVRTTVTNLFDGMTEIVAVTPAQASLISIIVTGGFAAVPIGITLFQYTTLKRRDEIKCICLYNSIVETLEKNCDKILALTNNTFGYDPKYVSDMATEWKIREKTWEDIDELEKLLYEHGNKGDDTYTRKTIEITSKMRELAHRINATYQILIKDTNQSQNKIILEVFNCIHQEFEMQTQKYRTDYLGKKNVQKK